MANIWDLFDLKGKVFFVAGGARDLGKDMAEALAEAHGDGMITSRTSESAQTTAASLSSSTGQTVLGHAMDATDEASIAAAVDACVSKFGRIDVLINNVGGGGKSSPGESTKFEERRLADWDRIVQTNLTAPWLVAKAVAPIMQKQNSGSIVCIASIAGMIGRDRRVYKDGMMAQAFDYAAVKGGVIGLMRDMAAYLGDNQIRVNAISPGGFERGQPQGFIDAYADKTILKRMGTDGLDLKGAAVFLASDASGYVTGHNLVVDGGFTVYQ